MSIINNITITAPIEGQTEGRKPLRTKIEEYLHRVGSVSDPKALSLLRQIVAFLIIQTLSEKATRVHDLTLNSILQGMQQTIGKLQKNDAKLKSYSNAARVVSESTMNRERLDVERKSQKTRMIREFTITISDEQKRIKLQNMIIKKIMNKMQREKKKIRNIVRLASDALRIQTKSAKIRNALQKKQKMLRRVIESITIRTRIFFVRVNDVRVNHIDVTNQTDAIAYLQAINVRLQSSLKIIRIA
jgi:hypothetical protein